MASGDSNICCSNNLWKIFNIEEVIAMSVLMEGLAEMVAKNSRQKVPLGTLLLADGLILPQDLEFALEHQKYSQQLLGEILVRMGALAQNELDRILKLQKKNPSN
jgi:hypothetical protein